MEFISIDIAHMEPDNVGYRYLLFIGDLLSTYIDAIPLKDQNSATIVNALSEGLGY